MKNKTIILISFLILLVIVILVFRSLAKNTNNTGSSQGTPSSSKQVVQLKILSTNIEDLMSINGSILIKFSQPVTKNISFSIEPSATVSAQLNSTQDEVTISPKDAWVFNTSYVIKILSSTLSKQGQPLDKDYIYNFKTPPYTGI